MKVIDSINKSITTYPTLFLARTWEESKHLVLHQDFIVLGNGMEWAVDKNGKNLGYLTSPSAYRDKEKDEWVSIPDKPYGEETFELDRRFFTEKVYNYGKIHKEFESGGFAFLEYDTKIILFESELKNIKDNYVSSGTKLSKNHQFTHVLEEVELNDIDRSPYPNFSKRYSCFWECDPNEIQPDWLEAGIEHLKYWSEWYKLSDLSEHHYYPDENSAKEQMEYIEQKYKKKEGWIELVRKDYDFSEFNGENYQQMVEDRFNKLVKSDMEFITETIARLEGARK